MSTQDFVSTLQIGQVWESVWKNEFPVPPWMNELCIIATIDDDQSCVIWANGEETDFEKLEQWWVYVGETRESFVINADCWAKIARTQPFIGSPRTVSIQNRMPVEIGNINKYCAWLTVNDTQPAVLITDTAASAFVLRCGDVLIQSKAAIFRLREITGDYATGYTFV